MHVPRRAVLAAVVALVAATPAIRPLIAQQPQGEQRVRQQRAELDRIRSERAELERRSQELRATIHDLDEEVANLDRRADATSRLVRALDEQLALVTAEVARASTGLVQSEDQLVLKRAILRRRLADIYKRGPLFTVEAMLSAQSFGELVARYKYLHLLALRDRALVRQVEELHRRVSRERTRLVALQRTLDDSRTDRAQEEERLRSLQRERELSRITARQHAQQTEARLARLRQTETQLTNAIAAFEEARRRAESRPNATRGTSTIRTSDYGNLDWPVNGPLVYTFGRARTGTNTTIRWNGVGIRAELNTPVRSVAAGRVVSVRQLGTYGLTVIVDHGGGDYSVYGSLSQAAVREGQTVTKGQAVGAVGISDPDLPPHLHFEIRRGGPAIDPAEWLRGR